MSKLGAKTKSGVVWGAGAIFKDICRGAREANLNYVICV
jgi:hypothetical protein